MLNLVISAALCWLGVHARACFTRVKRGYYCGNWDKSAGSDVNQHPTPEACATRCQNEFGSIAFAAFFRSEGYNFDFCECVPGGETCEEKVNSYTDKSSVFTIDSDCGGDDDGDDDDDDDDAGEPPVAEGRSCTVVFKKKACKKLSAYCDYDKSKSPRRTRCINKNPAVKIPFKEFCDAIPTRGRCKPALKCLWTGEICMLGSEGTCEDITKRRICNAYRTGNGCRNGKHCMMINGNCHTVTGSSC